MSEIFINKVNNVILQHIQDEDFNVNKLASELGYSRAQIYRKIKTLTGKNVNELIREVRLNKAIEYIKLNDYNCAEISYKVGFSSPQYFSKCFHEFYGITCSEFKEKDVQNTSEFKPIHKLTQSKYSKFLKILFLSVLIISACLAVFFIMKKPDKISIAILPLLDLSENKDQDYLSNGITEQITLELSKINDLRVISRTSAMSFKNENRKSTYIGRKLGVDYLLEGSVLHGNDSIIVVVQLIKLFPEEKHIWQDSYQSKLENILYLVQGIASKITSKINIAISSDKTIKDYKVNPKAYELFLRSRHLLNQQTSESVPKSIEIIKESLKIDSIYAPSYTILSEAYSSLHRFIIDNEEKALIRRKSIIAIDKAIELDKTLGDAYIIKGSILGTFDCNWTAMKSLLETGLKLDPNSASGHMALSYYYLVRNSFDLAIEEALVAEKLDPLNPLIGTLVAERYCMMNNYKKSIEQCNKVLEYFPNYNRALSELGFAYYLNGQINKSKNTFIQLQELMGNDDMVNAYHTKPFEKALKYWLSEIEKGAPRFCSYPTLVARVEMMVQEKQNALDYLEIAYEYPDGNLPKMMFWPDFHQLHNDPRFVRLVQKTNITLPEENQNSN